jgi:hypothetical protein
LTVGLRLAEVVERAVAGDPVEPGAEVDLAVVGDHRLVGIDEDLLKHVLCIFGRTDHLTAEAEQAALVAIDDHVEGSGVPGPDEGDELFIPLHLEQGRTPGKESSLCGGA